MATNPELRRMGQRDTFFIAAANAVPLVTRLVASASPVGYIEGGIKAVVEGINEVLYHEKHSAKWKRTKQVAAVIGSASRAAAPLVVLALVNAPAAIGTAAAMYAYENYRHNRRQQSEGNMPQDKQNNLIPSMQILGAGKGFVNWFRRTWS